jgi:hypothetical protein
MFLSQEEESFVTEPVDQFFGMLSILGTVLLGIGAIAAPSAPREAPEGFVTVNNGKFQLDGKDFYFAGSNAYYFPFNGVRIFLSANDRSRNC